MEFLITLFGLIYVGIRLMSESIDKDVRKRQEARWKAEMESYKTDEDEPFIVRDMIKYCREECIEMCKKYILPFSPDLTITDSRLMTLMFAMNGHYEHVFTPVEDWDLCGPSWHIQNQIEFWHQVENALHDAGRTDAKFYLRPSTEMYKNVTFDANGVPQFPYAGSEIVFGEFARGDRYCKRMW